MTSRGANSDSSGAVHSLDAAAIGSLFQEVAIDVLQGESTEILTRWYRTPRGEADLTIWWDGEKRIVKQQLCLYGQVVEWTPIHGTRTGLVVEHETSGDVDGKPGLVDSSEIIRFDRKVAPPSVRQAIQLLEALTILKAEERALLAFNFRESPRLHKNARERALREWAPLSATEITSERRPSLWKNLTHWLFGK